ncbi:MAG: dihydrolipoyl dehydrogenase [Polyangiales bacterium]
MDELFDVVVIGAGTAGLSAARAAHARGAKVALVDHGPLGTLCARKGCMPSKVLLQSSNAIMRTRRLSALGVHVEGAPSFEWSVMRARQRALIADFVGSVVSNIETSNAFTLVRGDACFTVDERLHVDTSRFAADEGSLGTKSSPSATRSLRAKSWVIATGSTVVIPAIDGLREVPFLTSDDVFDLETLPASIAVIGTGAIGVELGQFFARAGAIVHLIGSGSGVAGLSKGTVRDSLIAPLSAELEISLDTEVRRVCIEKAPLGSIILTLASKRGISEVSSERKVDAVLLATGRRPAIDSLGLEHMRVEVKDGVPLHDAHLRTSNPQVFVAGDAAGAPALLHTASRQGRAAGHNAHGGGVLEVPAIEPIMRVVFCDPAVATIGIDKETARDRGIPVVVAERAWSDQGKARVMNETEGVAQLVVHATTRKIIGCQLVGPECDLLIHLIAYAMHFGGSVDDLVAMNHYHPTLAEMIPSLAQNIIGQLEKRHCHEGDVAPCPALQ